MHVHKNLVVRFNYGCASTTRQRHTPLRNVFVLMALKYLQSCMHATCHLSPVLGEFNFCLIIMCILINHIIYYDHTAHK